MDVPYGWNIKCDMAGFVYKSSSNSITVMYELVTLKYFIVDASLDRIWYDFRETVILQDMKIIW